MKKVKDKLPLNIKRVLLLCLILLPSLVSSQETYRFERMWPTLPQPWYFKYPQDVAVAPDGSVYVADSGYVRIQKYNSNGHFITMWGSEGTGNGEFGAREAPLGVIIGPESIATDTNGNVYVTDTYNHRVQKFNSDGNFITKWGRNGGDGSYGTGNGEFQNPSDIALDSSGFIYVADAGNHRIQKFTPDGNFDIKWGRNGGDGSYGAGDGEFENPTGITVDASGFVYVADKGNERIQKFTSDGDFLLKWDNDLPGGAHYDFPCDIAVDENGNVYVTDPGHSPCEFELCHEPYIYKIDSDGQLVESWGNFGGHPSGIALDANGYVYVTDDSRDRIKKLTPTGQDLQIWGSSGVGEAQLSRPEGIAVGNNNTIYVTDNVQNCIHTFTSEGSYIASWRGGSETGEFKTPLGITVDDNNNVFVCDAGNNRVLKFTPDGQFITMWGGGDDLPFAPVGIALDSNGNVYITDHTSEVDFFGEVQRHHRVQKFKPIQGETGYELDDIWETWDIENEFFQPFGISVGRDETSIEHVYIADWGNPVSTYTGYVHKFTLDGEYITTWVGATEGSTFYRPRGIVTDDSDNVYIADYYNYRVLKFTPEGSFIASLGTLGTGPGQMNLVHHVAVDNDERVYVVDKHNNRIQVFSKTEGIGNNKAVIVAGGGPYPGNHLWDATQMTANFAYRTLRHQGFGPEDIYYLSADTDLDLDNDGFLNVFDVPSNQRLNDAIQLAVGNNADNLVLYFTDHGGADEDGSGIFRMNDSEILTTTDLATMVDDVQSSVPGRITLVIDACQSGSFINDGLLGDNHIIITSSASDEQAKFLNQGTISFSHFFWSYIFNGASLNRAFFNASQAVNFAISDQTPQEWHSSGVNLENAYIGNHIAGMIGEVPTIGGEVVSIPDELTIETSAVLFVDGVRDPNNDAITRVWAVVWPPDYDTGTIDDPLLELPTIDLYPVGENRYEGSYAEFHAVGTYQIAVYAMDEHGNTSLPRFSIVPKNVSRRAVIVAGGTELGLDRQMIEHNAGLAYNTLISQHYGSGNIYFMSPTTFLEDVITYLPERANFEGQLFTLASDEDIVTLDLTIYLIGGSEDGNFILNDDPEEYETLSASQLDEWLDALQAAKPGRTTVICDFDQSGSFLRHHTLPEGNQRITITSTGDETAAYFNTAGNISFSSFWWDQLAAGAFLKDAFIYSRKAIEYCSRTNDVSFSCYMPQSPLIDANGNGTPNETIDYSLVESIKIGDGIVTADDPPQIGSVSAVREGEMITITAEDISSTSPVSRVWAIINPLLYCPGSSEGSPQVTAEVDLEGPDADGKYTYTYPADYACKITVYAMSGTEEEPNISLPKKIRIYQEGGDIYEPDNYPSDANVIVVNYPTAQPHTFHGRDDEDWLKFYGLENNEADSIEDVYTVEASNLGENCPVIELYDADNLTVPIAVASNPPVDGKVWIDYRFQRNGIYYLRLVWGGCDWVEGKMHYDLKVFDGNQGLTAIVRGKVRDRISGAPINGAVIRSNGVGATISTHGEYLLSEIPGNWTITARKNGYTNSRAGIRIESVDQQIRKDIRMAPRIKRCSEDADCVDGDYCNGVEICLNEVCQPGTNPCGDDGFYCNGEEVGCDEENDTCVHSGSPCPGHQACIEEGEECVDKECAGNEDCDNGEFCDGVEVCINGLCQAGTNPCSEPTPECDEEQDICIEGPSIQLFPNPHLQLRWMPLLMFLRIVGTNTHFDGSTEVTFDPPGSVMSLPILGDEKHLFIIGFLLPSWLAPVESVDVTVSTPTGGEIVSEKLNLQILLFPNPSPRPSPQQGEGR